jgi:hypothetical protein
VLKHNTGITLNPRSRHSLNSHPELIKVLANPKSKFSLTCRVQSIHQSVLVQALKFDSTTGVWASTWSLVSCSTGLTGPANVSLRRVDSPARSSLPDCPKPARLFLASADPKMGRDLHGSIFHDVDQRLKGRSFRRSECVNRPICCHFVNGPVHSCLSLIISMA